MLREERMVATIDHPNVCTIYEIGTDDDRPYIVMQYIGGTLSDRAARSRLSSAEIIDIARQVASACRGAQPGIVHRDIKPGNIMINPSGLLKVLDFGLANRSPARDSPHRGLISTPGLVAGPRRTVPEQLRAEPLDGRSDLFSSASLYELAAGRRPFDRPTIAATITAVPPEIPRRSRSGDAIGGISDRPCAGEKASALSIGEGDDRCAHRSRSKRSRANESRGTPHARRIHRRGPVLSESADRTTTTSKKACWPVDRTPLAHQRPGRPWAGRRRCNAHRQGQVPPLGEAGAPLGKRRHGNAVGVPSKATAARIEALAEAAGRIKARSASPPPPANVARRRKSVSIQLQRSCSFADVQWNKTHPDAVRQAISTFRRRSGSSLLRQRLAGLADSFLMLGFLQVCRGRHHGKARRNPSGHRSTHDGRDARVVVVPGRVVRLGSRHRAARVLGAMRLNRTPWDLTGTNSALGQVARRVDEPSNARA